MPRLAATFNADGQESLELRIAAGQSYVLSLAPTPSLTGSIQLLARDDSPSANRVLQTFTAAQSLTEYRNDTGKAQFIRLRCVDLNAGTETVPYVLQSLVSTGRRYLVDHRPKVGTTAGWVVNAANNLGLCATLAASQTNSTLVVPLNNLEIGTRITGFYPVGQVESGGNTASITVNLRRLTAAAADVVDASVATSGSVSFTADSVLGRIGASAVDSLDEVVVDGSSYYFLVTGTTGVATDIALQGIVVQVENGIH
jgi:hypothetical protein